MEKIAYCLDTNVILHHAESIFKFSEHDVVIPMPVLEEIDTFKKDQTELGRNARAFSRYIDELREKGPLIQGVEIGDQGGKLFVTLFDSSVANCLPYQDMLVVDNRILASAVHFRTYKLSNHSEVILLSKDTNLRIKADVNGIKAEDYKFGKVTTDELYTGVENVYVPQELIDKIYDLGKLDVGEFSVSAVVPYPNQCFILHSEINTKQSALVRYNSTMKTYNLLPQDLKTVDILPKNSEQQFAMDMLKDTELTLCSLSGLAGSGKTLMALAAGLHGVLETQKYTKILLLKPIIAMDNSHELGFLPGSMEEKLGPWMASYGDNIELIMSKYMKDEELKPSKKKGLNKKESDVKCEKEAGRINPVQELIAHGLLEFGSLEHIRGRSLPNLFIIADETQNLSLKSLRTMITRVGEGTKIVLLGDPSQIDTPYLDSRSNGLTLAVEAFKDQACAGHITMKKSERSKLAEIAANIL